MSRPQRYLTRMILFLLVVGGVAGLVYPALESAFMANPVLNGLILGVLLAGIVYIIRQVLLLSPEVRWLERFQSGQPGEAVDGEPTLLAPMARMIGERRGRLTLSAISLRTVLDGINGRLDESRELSRYLIGLLIFLGLLGTFWGLLHTVQSVAGVIGGLSVEGTNDVASVFSNLQRGLEAPLTGMGQAFSASLFGLAGSLVLGFLELQASQAQNRFVMEVEDWLAGATRLSSGVGPSEGGEHSVSAYLQALLEQMAENLENLQRTVQLAEDGRRSSNTNLMALTDRLSILTDQMRAEQTLLVKLAENQLELKPVLQRLAEATVEGGFGMDDSTRQHIRNLDVYLARLLEDVSHGRNQAVQDIRGEIKLLARTIAALAEEGEPR